MKKWNSARAVSATAALIVMFDQSTTDAQAVEWVARFSEFKGDLSCRYGDPGCNRCTYDVEAQFRAMVREGRQRESTYSWSFGGDYEPSGDSVDDFLQRNPDESTHVQGIARASSASPNVLVSHAAEDRGGGLFLIDTDERADGRVRDGALEAIQRGVTHHTGGIQGLGEWFVIANDDDGAYLQFLNAADPLSPTVDRRINEDNALEAAAVAGAKLRGGGYVLATEPDSKYNGYQFWYTPSLDKPHLERVWVDVVPSAGQPDLGLGGGVAGIGADNTTGFEGISFVTECGTGNIYMVGVAGDPGFANNNGVWTLHRLSYEGKPRLRYVTRNTEDMHFPACNTRAGGSAFVGKYGELGLYCSQKGRQKADRINAFICAGELVFPLIAPVVEFIGWVFDNPPCTSILLGDDEVAYTEYWPNAPTPETPPGLTFGQTTLTVEAQNNWGGRLDGTCLSSGGCVYDHGQAIVVIDETPSVTTDDLRIETCTPPNNGYKTTCSYAMPYGSKVRVIAASDGSYAGFGDQACSVGSGLRNPATCNFSMGTAPRTVITSAGSLL
jgi:hypothetical protein